MDQLDWELVHMLSVEKSASKVANRLFISQPAVSYRLRRMETEYGKQLFIRTNKGIELTSAGNILLSYAEKMLNDYRQIVGQIRNDELFTNSITIGMPYVLTQFIAELIKDFSREYPNVNFHFLCDSSKNLVRKFQEGNLHITLLRGIFGDIPKKHTLFREPLRLISRDPVTFKTLQGIPFIDYEMAAVQRYWINLWSNTKLSSPLDKVRNATSLDACYNMVRARLGWSAVTSLLILIKDFSNMNTYLLTDQSGEPLYVGTQLLYSKRTKTSVSSSAFIEYILRKPWRNKIIEDLNDIPVQTIPQ